MDAALPQADRPVLIIDGAQFVDYDGFCRQFSTLLDGHVWRGHLDAFNDILRGGFGTPEDGFVLHWVRADRSRSALGYAATTERLERILTTCHPSNRPRVQERLELARREVGPTLFDEIVEIIRIHGPGGDESEDNVVLVLD
jgi:hypothetical protein